MSESIEDVVKRLRDRAEARRRSGKLLQIDDRMFDLIADEIEEATCDKSSQVGNAAAMYEALKAVVKVGYPHNFQHEAPHVSGYCYEIITAIDKCFAALAASPRNCDRPLIVDGPADNVADKAWLAFKRCNPDVYFDVSGLLRCIAWLLDETKGR